MMRLSKNFKTWSILYAAVVAFGAGAVAETTSPMGTKTDASDSGMVSNEAAKEAAKLVAPPGARVRLAEDQPEAVIPAAPVKVEGDNVVVSNASTSEVVEAKSGAELLKTLGLIAPPSQKRRGDREIDETSGTRLFDNSEIRRLLGESPTVVYQVVYEEKPLPDPMIIPWVRNAVILKERLDEAVALLGNGRVQEGRQALLAIISEFPNSEIAQQAQAILQKLETDVLKPEGAQAMVRATPTPPPVQIMVDPNVRISSILIDSRDPNENRVMINGRAYKAGDVIRGFSNHRVISVREGAVVIEVEAAGQRREFTITLKSKGID